MRTLTSECEQYLAGLQAIRVQDLTIRLLDAARMCCGDGTIGELFAQAAIALESGARASDLDGVRIVVGCVRLVADRCKAELAAKAARAGSR